MMTRTLLVIPHYRDAERLAPFLAELVTVLPAEFGIVVSDDGSGEAGVRAMRKIVADAQVTARERGAGCEVLEPLVALRNQGKGGAVYAGWRWGLAGDWDIFGFADADGAVTAREILRASRAFAGLGEAVDGLIGSRVKMKGRVVDRRLSRHLAGRVFATAVTMLAGLDAYDTQCGFKVFRRRVIERVLGEARAFGFAFDVELLLLVAAAGYRVEEFPVDWRDVAGGKVNLWRDPIPMLLEVVRARQNARNFERGGARPDRIDQ